MRKDNKFLSDVLNNIWLGDNVSMMANLPSDCIDLCVTSPPYDGIREYTGYSYDFEKTAIALSRVIKDNGVIVWNVADEIIDYEVLDSEGNVEMIVENTESLTSFENALFFRELGFSVHTMIFNKINFVPVKIDTAQKYAKAFEYIFVMTKGKYPRVFNKIMLRTENAGKVTTKSRYAKDGSISFSKMAVNDKKVHPNVFSYLIGNGNNDDKTTHPASFPEQFARDMIYSYSNEGDIVLDIFGGSFTTAKIAALMNRNFITSEISEQYVNEYSQRIAHYTKKQHLIINERDYKEY